LRLSLLDFTKDGDGGIRADHSAEHAAGAPAFWVQQRGRPVAPGIVMSGHVNKLVGTNRSAKLASFADCFINDNMPSGHSPLLWLKIKISPIALGIWRDQQINDQFFFCRGTKVQFT
jgi:hypothetical protein